VVHAGLRLLVTIAVRTLVMLFTQMVMVIGEQKMMIGVVLILPYARKVILVSLKLWVIHAVRNVLLPIPIVMEVGVLKMMHGVVLKILASK